MMRTLALACSALALSGCIIVSDPSDWDDDHNDPGWQERQQVNREYIADLTMGRALADVRNYLGRPDYSEGYRDDQGREITILRYRTHHRHSDGDTSQDETTPLVFVDGALAQWGASAVEEEQNPPG